MGTRVTTVFSKAIVEGIAYRGTAARVALMKPGGTVCTAWHADAVSCKRGHCEYGQLVLARAGIFVATCTI